MTATLRETKAKLSEMVKRASQGEEILITVHGKVQARLTQPLPKSSAADNRKWARELAALRRKYSTGKCSRTGRRLFPRAVKNASDEVLGYLGSTKTVC